MGKYECPNDLFLVYFGTSCYTQLHVCEVVVIYMLWIYAFVFHLPGISYFTCPLFSLCFFVR